MEAGIITETISQSERVATATRRSVRVPFFESAVGYSPSHNEIISAHERNDRLIKRQLFWIAAFSFTSCSIGQCLNEAYTDGHFLSFPFSSISNWNLNLFAGMDQEMRTLFLGCVLNAIGSMVKVAKRIIQWDWSYLECKNWVSYQSRGGWTHCKSSATGILWWIPIARHTGRSKRMI